MFKVMITPIVVCFLLLSSNPAHGTIIKVPQNQPTIQAGIDNAVNGDVVLVSPGTYNESTISFDGKAITVMSKDPLDPAVVAATIVDCGSIINEYVFVFTSEENLSSVLAGFTITGGEGPGGGGIFCGASSSPTIAYNIITGNSGQHGGGINCFQSSPRILNNTIAENTASDDGGGIFLIASSPRIIKNTIKDNSVIVNGISTTAWGQGGGICCLDDSAIIRNNSITGNSVSGSPGKNVGGGIYCYQSTTTIVNNIISENSVTGTNSTAFGGGICIENSSLSSIVVNNTITGNSASGGGGGIHLTLGSDMTISNTILWDNYAPEGAEIWMGSVSQPSILTISYSNVSGVPTSVHIEPGSTVNRGPGNISADPFFITYQGLEYFLGQGSPCIDAGDPGILDACRPPGLVGERSDMGVYGGENNCGWLP